MVHILLRDACIELSPLSSDLCLLLDNTTASDGNLAINVRKEASIYYYDTWLDIKI